MRPGSFREHLIESLQVKQAALSDAKLCATIDEIARICSDALRNGNKILVAGNGGSAADAQHFAGELVSRFYFDRPGLPGIALTTDTSILTAIGNDYGYERIFSRQVQALGRRGDIFFGISTSGNSPNILMALAEARNLGMMTMGMTGTSGGKIQPLCDLCVCAPSDSTPRIQEVHGAMIHAMCALIESSIFGSDK